MERGNEEGGWEEFRFRISSGHEENEGDRVD